MVFKKINVKTKKQSFFSPDKTLYIAFGISLLLHGIVIYTIPAAELFSENPGGSDPIFVDFLEEEVVAAQTFAPSAEDNQFLAAQPEALKTPEPLPEPSENEQNPASAENTNDPDVPYTFLKERQLPDERLKAPPAVEQKALDIVPGFKKRPLKKTDENMPETQTLAGTGFSSGKQKRLVGFDKKSSDDQNRFGIFAGEKLDAPDMQAKETIQEALLTEQKPQAPGETVAAAKALDLSTQIEGPAKGRKISYQPTPPKVGEIQNEVELRLKFWVLPDGTIGEVIPLKRGDANLERIAIAYLKKWQFEPLASNVSQQQVWGTIPIKFTTQ